MLEVGILPIKTFNNLCTHTKKTHAKALTFRMGGDVFASNSLHYPPQKVLQCSSFLAWTLHIFIYVHCPLKWFCEVCSKVVQLKIFWLGWWQGFSFSQRWWTASVSRFCAGFLGSVFTISKDGADHQDHINVPEAHLLQSVNREWVKQSPCYIHIPTGANIYFF